MKKVRMLLLLFIVLFGGRGASGQEIAVKTNVLYWGTTTPNLALEFGLGRKTTLEIGGGYNPWTLDKEENKKLKHYLIQPEFRYWPCERFNGHFFGIHTGYTEYNVGRTRVPFTSGNTKEHRYEGWATGVGISYGYEWILGGRWNLEATVGVGYVYTSYKRYECVKCGNYQGKFNKSFFAPMKLGVSVVYLIK